MEAETASVTVLEQLPEPVLSDLRQIAGWLLCCGYDTDFMQVYATVRSPLLVKSLHTCVTYSLMPLHLLYDPPAPYGAFWNSAICPSVCPMAQPHTL